MDPSQRNKRFSMNTLLSGVVDKMLRLQPVVPEKNHALDLVQRQANIRAVSLREGFQTIRDRGAEMSQRLDHYKRQHIAMIARRNGIAIEPENGDDSTQAIVITS
jgi:hypothetical protein